MQQSTQIVAWVGVACIAMVLAAAVFAPVLAEHPPNRTVDVGYLAPSFEHPLGTDDLGRDLWSQLLYGARVSLVVGLAAAIIAVTVGTTVALISGYRGGLIDAALMRTVDLVLSVPFLVLVLVLVSYFGRGLVVSIALIAGVLWARPARLLRGQVLKVKEFEHVVAAEAMGARLSRILGRHVLPRLVPLISSQFVRAAAVAVIVQSAIAFLGLGDPSTVSWGATLSFANNGNAILTDAWKWWVLPPGLALTVLIVGFAFIGYAFEEWADPRLDTFGRIAGTKRRLDPEPAEPTRPDQTLAVRDLSVVYETEPRAVRAVSGVDVVVRENRVIGLVGESGSGKSTLALSIMGLLTPPGRVISGQIVLRDTDLRRLGRVGLTNLRGRRFSLVPQAAMSLLDPIIPVHAQVVESARLGNTSRDAHRLATDMLTRVGIDPARHGAFPHELSGGMRQRIVIAMAVVNRPELLVADEPTSGLDVVTQREILGLLDELRNELGMDVMVITHDLRMIGSLADDIAIMYAGRIVEDGVVDEVFARPQHPYTQLLVAAFPSVKGERAPLRPIPGEPPDPTEMSPGCSFAPRCPVSIDICTIETPTQSPVACHLVPA